MRHKGQKSTPMLESLESRTMMSVTVTSAQLTADNNAIVAAKTAYASTINSLGSQLLSGGQALEGQIPPGKAALALGKKALAAGTKAILTIKKETAAIEKDSVSFAAKAVAAGNAAITKPSAKADAKAQKAGQALLSKFNADEAKISNDQSLFKAYVALNAIVLANPSATTFATTLRNLENAVPVTAIPAADADLQLKIDTLAQHVGVAFT